MDEIDRDLVFMIRGMELSLAIIEDNRYNWGLHNYGPSGMSPREKIKEQLIRELSCQIEEAIKLAKESPHLLGELEDGYRVEYSV